MRREDYERMGAPWHVVRNESITCVESRVLKVVTLPEIECIP